MTIFQIIGIVLIVCGVYIFYQLLDKLSDKTKCKMAKNIKKWGPYLIGVVGLWTIIELIVSFPINKNEILMLINGSKSFLETNQNSQRTIISIILLIIGSVLYLLGQVLYAKWICHKFIGVDENES